MEDRHETLFIYETQDKNERCELFSMQVVCDDDEGGQDGVWCGVQDARRF